MNAYERLFRELEKRDARYVLVGGLAVLLRGYVRLQEVARQSGALAAEVERRQRLTSQGRLAALSR